MSGAQSGLTSRPRNGPCAWYHLPVRFRGQTEKPQHGLHKERAMAVSATKSSAKAAGKTKGRANGKAYTNGKAQTGGVGADRQESTWLVKKGLAQMLKGGVIMDVVTEEHARIAEDSGAVAVMALERVPSDIRAAGGVARMSDPELIYRIMETVTIPVMAKARIGHFVEAQLLEAMGVDYVDESEVLTPADDEFHINKH